MNTETGKQAFELAYGQESDEWKPTSHETLLGDLKAFPHLQSHEENSLKGLGGTAAVYRIWNDRLKDFCAVKLLREDKVNDETFLRRFEREIQHSQQLSEHPAFPTHYEDGCTKSGVRFFIREWIEGIHPQTQGRLEDSERVIEELCEGAAHAEGLGIVFRDLKLENSIIKSRNQSLTIIDVGFAKQIKPSRLPPFSSDPSGSVLTRTGEVVGTYGHIAPEVLAGSPVTEKATVYSIGAIMYQLFTGRLPQVGTLDPVSRWIGTEKWDMVVEKALASDPEKRWGNVRVLHDEITTLNQQNNPMSNTATISIKPFVPTFPSIVIGDNYVSIADNRLKAGAEVDGTISTLESYFGQASVCTENSQTSKGVVTCYTWKEVGIQAQTLDGEVISCIVFSSISGADDRSPYKGNLSLEGMERTDWRNDEELTSSGFRKEYGEFIRGNESGLRPRAETEEIKTAVRRDVAYQQHGYLRVTVNNVSYLSGSTDVYVYFPKKGELKFSRYTLTEKQLSFSGKTININSIESIVSGKKLVTYYAIATLVASVFGIFVGSLPSISTLLNSSQWETALLAAGILLFFICSTKIWLDQFSFLKIRTGSGEVMKITDDETHLALLRELLLERLD